MCRAGWEAAVTGGPCCFSMGLWCRGADKVSAWQWLLQVWSRDPSITKCSLGVVLFPWHLHKRVILRFWFADGEAQMACLVSEGPRNSPRCVEQTPAPQADVLTTARRFWLKHRCDAGVNWALLGIILCVAIFKRPHFPLMARCFSKGIGMEQRRHPVAGCVHGRWGRVSHWEPCWGVFLIAKGGAPDVVQVSCCSHQPRLEAHTSHGQRCVLHRGDWIADLPLSPWFLYSWIYSYTKGAREEVF